MATQPNPNPTQPQPAPPPQPNPPPPPHEEPGRAHEVEVPPGQPATEIDTGVAPSKR